MFGRDPFDQLAVDTPAVGRGAPLWVHVALFGPFALFIAWVLAGQLGVWYDPLLWATIGSAGLGFGSVLAACVYHLLTGRRTTPATKEAADGASRARPAG